jgi:hypothetical protein
LCNASTTCYVFKITKTLKFMKNGKKTQNIQNNDMDAIIENQNNNKQWIHMLNDLQRNKLDTPVLELQNHIIYIKNCM